ncbi:MAG TPA: hypothetical protein VGK87_09290 [Anaerolineae bacterium]
MRSRKNHVFAVMASLFAAFSLVLSGCGVVNDLAEISGSGNAFLAALAKGDTAGAAAMMHSRALASGDMAAALKTSFVDQKFGGVSIDNTKVENGVGTLSGKCSLTDSSGQVQIGTLTLQLQKDTDDKWKVLNINCKVS